MNMASATFAFDRKSARSFDADGRMRVRDCIISVAEVNPYYGREIPGCSRLGLDANRVYDLLRDPDELARAAPTFDGLSLMIRHVAQTADEPRKEYIGGSVFNTRYVDGKLRADLLIFDRKAIEYVESGELADLSSSYRYVPEMVPGDYNGRHFDGRMRNIEGNHVALVEDGRATGAHVADRALASPTGANIVEENANNSQAEVAKALMLLTEKMEEFQGRLAKLEGGTESVTVVEEPTALDSAEADKAEDSDKVEETDKAEDSVKTAETDKAEDSDKAEETDKAEDNRPAMDAKTVQSLIDAAVAQERQRAQDVEKAKLAVRPVLGDVIAMDSAADIYRAALEQVGVPSADIPVGTEQVAWVAFQSASGRRVELAHDARSVDKQPSPFDAHINRIRKA